MNIPLQDIIKAIEDAQALALHDKGVSDGPLMKSDLLEIFRSLDRSQKERNSLPCSLAAHIERDREGSPASQ